MNDWQHDTWKHLSDLCPNWWVGFAYGFVVAVVFMYTLKVHGAARATRALIQRIDSRAKGQPGETCIVCHHTRAEGFRFLYPFNQSVCSNCMADNLVVNDHIVHTAKASRTKGLPEETCIVCHHTRAEGFRFLYPFNQSVCSNCMVDDLVVNDWVSDRIGQPQPSS